MRLTTFLITLWGEGVSRDNIKALGRVNFSAKIDLLAKGGLRIGKVEHIENIGSEYLSEKKPHMLKLNKIVDTVRLIKKQKKNY